MTERGGAKCSAEKDLGGEVRIWYLRLALDSEGHAQCTRPLDYEERQRAQRFRFEEHRRRFVAGRGMLRMILGHYAACDPENMRLEYGEHGKPSFTGPGSVSGLKFSVSNSAGMGAVAVASGIELGLDLEQIRPSGDHNLIASREFSSDEKNWFLGLPEAERTAAFFDLWTCKEAYLKGKGLGLNAPLNHFSVSLGSDMPPRLAWSEIDREDSRRWRLHRLVIEPGCAACLAVDGDCHAIRVTPWRLPA